MDQWPNGPEIILDELEALQEIWADIKDEGRELCNRPAHVVVRNSRINWDSDLVRRLRGGRTGPPPQRQPTKLLIPTGAGRLA